MKEQCQKKKKKFPHEDVIQIRLYEKYPVLNCLNINCISKRETFNGFGSYLFAFRLIRIRVLLSKQDIAVSNKM